MGFLVRVQDVVLWNPYGNDDMGYKNFICIENGVIEKPVTLKGGEVRARLRARLRAWA
jgi:D-hexose-6-phosphate mutarotase